MVTAVQCPPPENPRHGKAIYTSCSYNSVVSYECKYGYTLVGEGTRRCGADKKWSGAQPVCKGLQKELLFFNYSYSPIFVRFKFSKKKENILQKFITLLL